MILMIVCHAWKMRNCSGHLSCHLVSFKKLFGGHLGKQSYMNLSVFFFFQISDQLRCSQVDLYMNEISRLKDFYI